MANTSVETSDSADSLRRSSRYWLDDGSIVVQAENDLYKVHRTLLDRHSIVLSSLAERTVKTGSEQSEIDGCPLLLLPEELGVASPDFEALLEYLYHDCSLDEVQFTRIASLLRVSSKKQLDFPTLYQLTRRRLESMIPSEPQAFFEMDRPDDALTLAVEQGIHSIQKALFYTVATHAHLDHEEPEALTDHPTTQGFASQGDPSHPTQFNLSPTLTAQCQALLTELVAHFTPILFTVATAGHMQCTDVFAETWMPLVIQPALENNGLCRPLETLQTIMDLDWESHGLCKECVRDKREEWKKEQTAVWEKMDYWLGLVGKQ